jgi:hypothetical protein
MSNNTLQGYLKSSFSRKMVKNKRKVAFIGEMRFGIIIVSSADTILLYCLGGPWDR